MAHITPQPSPHMGASPIWAGLGWAGVLCPWQTGRGGAWLTTWGPAPRLLLCLGAFWSRAEAPHPEAAVLPTRGLQGADRQAGQVERAGVRSWGWGDREAWAVSRTRAAGAVMLRDWPGRT